MPADTDFSETSYLYKRPHLSRRLGSEMVVVASEMNGKEPVHLNVAATDLWDRVGTGEPIHTLLDRAADIPDAHQRQRRFDEAALIEVLIDLGLLERSAHRPERSTYSTIKSGVPLMTPVLADSTDDEPPRSLNDLFNTLLTFEARVADTCVRLDDFDMEARDVIDRVEVSGALGPLAHAIDLGWVTASAAQRDIVQERWAANQLHCLRVEKLLINSVQALLSADITTCVLKGVAVAHLDYPDPSYREFGDADILVRPNDFDEAIRVLTDSALQLKSISGDDPHPFQTKGLSLITSDQLILDVHTRLARGGLGLAPLDSFFENPTHFQIGGIDLRAPSRAARLVHASVHWFTSASIRLGTLRDFVELADANPDEVCRLATQLRVTGAIKKTLSTPEAKALDSAPLDSITAHLNPSFLESVIAAGRPGTGLSRSILWRESSELAMTRQNRMKYLSTRLLPSRGFRARKRITWQTYAEVFRGASNNPTRGRPNNRR